MQGIVPISELGRRKRDPRSLYHANLLGSYDFFGTYQHAEWYPNFFSLEMIDDEQYRKLVRYAMAIGTSIATYDDLGWRCSGDNEELVFKLDLEDETSTDADAALDSSSDTEPLKFEHAELLAKEHIIVFR